MTSLSILKFKLQVQIIQNQNLKMEMYRCKLSAFWSLIGLRMEPLWTLTRMDFPMSWLNWSFYRSMTCSIPNSTHTRHSHQKYRYSPNLKSLSPMACLLFPNVLTILHKNANDNLHESDYLQSPPADVRIHFQPIEVSFQPTKLSLFRWL